MYDYAPVFSVIKYSDPFILNRCVVPSVKSNVTLKKLRKRTTEIVEILILGFCWGDGD